MPIHRFRDLDEARRALWADASDPSLAARIHRLWQFSRRLASPRIPRGLRRFRTIEDANEERERWVQERVQALLIERGQVE